ncbi:MAG TPA: ABC transporter ATP-binding protein, partial [Anaerolineales bacterium]
MTEQTNPTRPARPPGSQSAGLLQRYLRPELPRVLLLALLLLSGIALQLANPQVIRAFIDTAQSRGPQRTLFEAAGLFIGISLAGHALALAASTLAENLSWTSTNRLRRDLALHCLQLDLSFHKKHTPGELIERIDGDTTALAYFLSSFTIQIVGNALLIAGILVLLCREDLRVGLGLALFTLVVLLLLGVIQKIAVGRWAAERQASAEQYGYLEERIAGAEDLRASGAEAYALRRLDGLSRTVLARTRLAYVVGGLTSNLTELLFALGYATGLALGAYLYLNGQASLGTAYLVVSYVGMLSEPLQRIRAQLQDFQQASASIQRIQELFALQPRIRDEALADRKETGSPSQLVTQPAPLVEFRAVSFRYDDDSLNNGNGSGPRDALSGVSFTLQPGRVLGVLGRTGSGKTTLTRLLFRLYDPIQGQVCLGGRDLQQTRLEYLRRQVGMVTQDVQIFQASLRDNIAFFDPRISDGQILDGLHELGLEAWYHRL